MALIYFTTDHRPIVGEEWHHVSPRGWGSVVIEFLQGRMVYARNSTGQIYGWGMAPFLEGFTRWR